MWLWRISGLEKVFFFFSGGLVDFKRACVSLYLAQALEKVLGDRQYKSAGIA